MREGVTNKGGGLSRCAKGSQTRAGGYRAEERNRQTYKWVSGLMGDPKFSQNYAKRLETVPC